MTVPGVPRQRRKFGYTDSDSLDETQLHNEFDELPFDNVSIYSSPSMLSINSAVPTVTNGHEGDKHDVVIHALTFINCYYTYTFTNLYGRLHYVYG